MCPSPVRRVEIPKPNGGVRGSWASRRCSIGSSSKCSCKCCKPIFDPTFSAHSYGFRPGRSAHEAVRSGTSGTSKQGKDWVVDMDIAKFFDRVNHDILMKKVGSK